MGVPTLSGVALAYKLLPARPGASWLSTAAHCTSLKLVCGGAVECHVDGVGMDRGCACRHDGKGIDMVATTVVGNRDQALCRARIAADVGGEVAKLHVEIVVDRRGSMAGSMSP